MNYSRKDIINTIWIFAAINSFFVLMMEGWVIPLPLILALIATVIIWVTDKTEKTVSANKVNATTINTSEKRGDNSAYTMALLMEMMDDDEREEFKHDLKNRILSGESVTDESIIMEMEKRKRG